MARHHRLRHQAAQMAAAQAAPERHATQRAIHSTHRDERRTQASIDSMAAAEQAALDQARREIRNNTALTREDRATALAQLSTQRLNVAAGADYLSRETRQDFAGQRADLRDSLISLSQEQGANAASALQQLLAQRQATKADTAAAQAQRRFDARQGALDRQAATASDKRDAGVALQTAQKAAGDIISTNGIPLSGQDWQAFEKLLNSTEGVDPQTAAKIVRQIKKGVVRQVIGGAEHAASAGTVEGMLGSLLGSTLGILGPGG